MDPPTMRSFQFSDVQEAVGQRPGSARDFVDQLNQWQRGDEGDRRRDRAAGIGRIDLAIGALSLLLAVLAWRRDRVKSRREFVDGAVFTALGVLEEYVDSRQRSRR